MLLGARESRECPTMEKGVDKVGASLEVGEESDDREGPAA